MNSIKQLALTAGRVCGLAAFVTGVVLTSDTASASEIRASVERLSYPKKFHVAKDFKAVGESDNTIVSGYGPDPAGNIDSDRSKSYAYGVYTARTQGTIRISPKWVTPVPDPSRRSDGSLADNCEHAHLFWAVYAYGREYDPFFGDSDFYQLVSSTGEMGRRIKDGVQVPTDTPGAACVVSSQQHKFIDFYNGTFIWGPDDVNAQEFYGSFTRGSCSESDRDWGYCHRDEVYRDVTQFGDEIIVAAQARTHGWGGCRAFACYMPVELNVVRIN